MDARKLSNDELILNYNRYSRELAKAKLLDKRYYNNKIENTYAKSMLSIVSQEMKKRGLI